MDATEAQLRFGASLTHSADPTHPGHPLHNTGINAAGKFYLTVLYFIFDYLCKFQQVPPLQVDHELIMLYLAHRVVREVVELLDLQQM